jgi:hypothetical protein
MDIPKCYIHLSQFMAVARGLSRRRQAVLLCHLLRGLKSQRRHDLALGQPLHFTVPDKIVLPLDADPWPWLRRALWPELPEERTWHGLPDDEERPETITGTVVGYAQ